MPEIEAPG